MLSPNLRTSAFLRIASSVHRLCELDAGVDRRMTIQATMETVDAMDDEQYAVTLLLGLHDDALGHA